MSVSTVGRILSRAIALDVGNEFMAESRTPAPNSASNSTSSHPAPQWNGCVARTARIEFWNFLDCELTVEAVSRELPRYGFFYNFERSHSALDCLVVSPPTSTLSPRRLPNQCQMY